MHYNNINKYFSVLLLLFPIVPILGNVEEAAQNNANLLLGLAEMYGQKLEDNGGSGQLREFVKKIASQTNAMMAQMKGGCEAIGSDDPALARTYAHLWASLGAINGGDSSVAVAADGFDALKSAVVEAVFVVADRMGIPREQIVGANGGRLQKGDRVELLEELAKNWDQNNWTGSENGENNEQNWQHKSEGSRQKQRETLKMILAAIDDANIGTVANIMPRNTDGNEQTRRRRKKRDQKMIFAIAVVVVLFILAILCCFVGRICVKSSSSGATTSAAHSATKSADGAIKVAKFSFNSEGWGIFPTVRDRR